MSYQLSFNSPWYLLHLLVLLPALLALVVAMSLRGLRALGSVRRWVALGLRAVVVLLIVLALAEVQLVRTSPNLTVIYLIDHSLSISGDQTALELQYVNEAIARQRGKEPLDRAGVIVFGRDPAVEIPPLDEDQSMAAVESRVDREFTNLAGAMKLAQGLFLEQTARRVVILSDGNENLGDAMQQSRAMTDAGISIDVVPIRSSARGDVAVEKVSIPADIRKGEPFNLRVVLNNTTPPDRSGGQVKGKLRVYRRTQGTQMVESEHLLNEEDVTLVPGKRLISYSEKIDQPDFYTYEARFVPDEPDHDSQPQNNAATTFTHVRGSGQVLVIENRDFPGEHEVLVDRLRKNNLEVTVRTSKPEDLFTDLGQLQPFDTVVLANVPREDFTDEQIAMLVRNTQVMGAGLVMLGGEHSFGAGGWTGTPVEDAMPVDFQIKSAEVMPVGALAMIMHASEMADGNHWQKVIAQEAIKTLGRHDYCGVLHFQANGDAWLWNPGMLQVGPYRARMLTLLDRMVPGDMPAFEPSMIMAYNGLMSVKSAGMRHLIIISDGDPQPPGQAILRRLKSANITLSTVAIGFHSTPTTLQQIVIPPGKFYPVTNPNALPRIFQREARRVARPLVYENKSGFRPQVVFPHEMLQGVDNLLPPITGYVRTSRKASSLAEVSILSPLPDKATENPLLASWTFGQGKAAALTTDAGKRWASEWTGWAGYEKLFSQLIRWSMRPVDEAGKFSVATDLVDGKLKVVVTALTQDDEYLNFLNIAGTVVGPDTKPLDLELRQVAPGRYVGDVEAMQKGNYFVTLSPGAGKAPLRAGASVPYSDEFRDRETNEGLLTAMAAQAPKGGAPGQVIDAPSNVSDSKRRLAQMLNVDTFRHDLPKATSSQDIWHLAVLWGACLFFCDVFTRRVNVSFAWAPPLAARARDVVLRRQAAPVPSPVLERLRSRKAEVVDQLEQKRAAARFEPSPDAPPAEAAEPVGRPGAAASASAKASGGVAESQQPDEEDSYTNRLLKAKQKVWDQRDKEKR